MSSMTRSFHPLIVAGLLFTAAACEDDPLAPTTSSRGPAVVEITESIPGILVAADMLQSGDRMIPLVGWQTELLFPEHVGDEVLLTGTIDELDGALIIHEYQLLSVGGFPVLDGVLRYGEGGYWLEGPYEMVRVPHNAPLALDEHIGSRVWIAVWDGRCVDYGVLETFVARSQRAAKAG